MDTPTELVAKWLRTQPLYTRTALRIADDWTNVQLYLMGVILYAPAGRSLSVDLGQVDWSSLTRALVRGEIQSPWPSFNARTEEG